MRYMTQKQIDMAHGYHTKNRLTLRNETIENNTNPMSARAREGSPFLDSDSKDGVFLC